MATVKMKHKEFDSKRGGMMYDIRNNRFLKEDGKELGVKVTILKNDIQKLQGSEKNIVRLLNQWGVPGKSLKSMELNYKRGTLSYLLDDNQNDGRLGKFKIATKKFRR